MSDWSLAEAVGRALVDPDAVPHAVAGPFACRRCACGGYVWARPTDPGPSVAAHNRTPRHARWWAMVEREWQG